MATVANSLLQQNIADVMRIVRRLGPSVTTMLWGSPGIGKTEATKQTFKDHKVVLVLAGCSEPTDISGVPHYFEYGKEKVATKILPPHWAWEASVEAPKELWKPTVLFFDDIPTGHEQTQAACFKVFGERKVGNLDLRDDVYVIGAGNRIEDKSATYDMPLALANRMKHYNVKADVDAWIAWAIDAKVHPIVLAYIRHQGQNLNRFEEHLKTDTSEKAFATPRSWDMLHRSMFKMDPTGAIGDWLYSTAAGCIGGGLAGEFTVFANNTTKLIPADEIVKNPKTAPIPQKHEIDVIYATISGLEYYINDPSRYHHWSDALVYVLRPELEAEFGLIIAKMVTNITFNKITENDRIKACKNPHFIEMYNKYGIYLNDNKV